jgi:hypothetical protein
MLYHDYWPRLWRQARVPYEEKQKIGLEDSHAHDLRLAESLMASPATIKITTSSSDQRRGTWHGVPIMIQMYPVDRPTEQFSHAAKVHLRHLQDLRGAVVPEFFGLYRTDSQALLIYEDVGGFYVDSWSDLDFQERCAIICSPFFQLIHGNRSLNSLGVYCVEFLVHMSGIICARNLKFAGNYSLAPCYFTKMIPKGIRLCRFQKAEAHRCIGLECKYLSRLQKDLGIGSHISSPLLYKFSILKKKVL